MTTPRPNSPIDRSSSCSTGRTCSAPICTGPGISDISQTQIFDPFYRDNQANKGLVAGSGLGLFIAKEATSLLKGEISMGPKQTYADIGAHFILRIPHSSLSFIT